MSKEKHLHGAVHPAIPAGGAPDPADYRGVFLKIGNENVGVPTPGGQTPSSVYEIVKPKNMVLKATDGNNGLVHFTISFDSESAVFQNDPMTNDDIMKKCKDSGYLFMGFSGGAGSTTIGMHTVVPRLFAVPDPEEGPHSSISLNVTMAAGKVNGASGTI